VGGRCRPTASGMLRLPAQTRGSGEKCRGPRRASPKEESTVREREKKGGGHGGDRTTPVYRGARWSGSEGGPAVSGTTRQEEEWGVPAARGERGGVQRPRRASNGAGSRPADTVAMNRGVGVTDMWGLGHSTVRHGKI
jgi:hypothetical protein